MPDSDLALFRELVSTRQPELARRFFTTDAHRHLGLPRLPIPVKVYADSQLLSSDISVYQQLTPARERAAAGLDCTAMPPWGWVVLVLHVHPCVFLCVLCVSVRPCLLQDGFGHALQPHTHTLTHSLSHVLVVVMGSMELKIARLFACSFSDSLSQDFKIVSLTC